MVKSHNKFELFKSEVQRFVKYFGLTEYELRIECLDLSENDNLAECRYYKMDGDLGGTNMVAAIVCDIDWINGRLDSIYESSDEHISRIAFHEVLELLLSQNTEFALRKEIFVSEREVITENHRIIRRLENTIWEDFLKFKPKEKKMAKKEKGSLKSSSKKVEKNPKSKKVSGK